LCTAEGLLVVVVGVARAVLAIVTARTFRVDDCWRCRALKNQEFVIALVERNKTRGDHEKSDGCGSFLLGAAAVAERGKMLFDNKGPGFPEVDW
jgi:hypothetical protein